MVKCNAKRGKEMALVHFCRARGRAPSIRLSWKPPYLLLTLLGCSFLVGYNLYTWTPAPATPLTSTTTSKVTSSPAPKPEARDDTNDGCDCPDHCADAWREPWYKRQTKELHLEVMRLTASIPAATQRAIVIAQNVKSDEEINSWAQFLGAPYIIVPSQHTTHQTGESVAWLRYIVDFYDKLPEHIVFLTDAGPDWHSTADWSIRIRTSAPICRESLGRVLGDTNKPWASDMNAITTIFEVLAKSHYDPDLSDGFCCSESIISRNAIRQYPLERYIEVRSGEEPFMTSEDLFPSNNNHHVCMTYSLSLSYMILYLRRVTRPIGIGDSVSSAPMPNCLITVKRWPR